MLREPAAMQKHLAQLLGFDRTRLCLVQSSEMIGKEAVVG